MSNAYKAACTSAGCRIITAAAEAYDSGASELICSGHRTVELLDKRMVDLDVAPLAVALEESNPFSTVDLSYNALSTGAAESLRKFVASDTKTTSLNLSQNSMNASAVSALCAGLKSNTTIQELNLSGNQLGGQGGMALADLLQTNKSLTAVHASNCELDTAALVALATVLNTELSGESNLRVLDVSRPLAKTLHEEPASHFARMLKVNTNLAELDLSKCGMKDYGLQLIAQSVWRAGPMSGLLVLKLKGNDIQFISDDCVTTMTDLLSSDTCRLQELLLNDNRLRDEGALKLAEVVQASKKLSKLGVTSNSMTSRGLCALANAVKSNHAISDVELWGNRFDSAACHAWIPTLQYIKLDIAVQEVDGAYHCVRG